MELDKWIQKANKRFVELRPQPSEDIEFLEGEDGFRAILRNPPQETPAGKSGGGGASLVRAKITGSTDTWTYTADLYTNLDKAATLSGVTVKVLTDQLYTGEVIPNDTVLAVAEMEWGTTGSEVTYWTVIEHVGSI